MKDIKAMRDNAKKHIEALNMAVWSEDAAKIEEAKKSANNAIGAVNKAILENDFESFKGSPNPAEAMFTKRVHYFDKMKSSKIKGTERTLYEYKSEDAPKPINLDTAIGYGIITSAYREDLKELYDRFAHRYTARIKAAEEAAKKAEKKGREPDPYGVNEMFKLLNDVFTKLGIVSASPIRQIIPWMEPNAISRDKNAPNNKNTTESEVRDLDILDIVHCMLTGKALTFNGKKI